MDYDEYLKEQENLEAEDNYFEALGFLNDGVMGKGSISKKHKELIGLAVAICLKSEENIVSQLRNCKVLECSKREIIEALKISVSMGGKVLLPTAGRAIKIYEEIEIE